MKCRVIVSTYIWATYQRPKISSCYIVEGDKKLSIRVKYKFNHRSSYFATYVLYPVSKYMFKKKITYEMEGMPSYALGGYIGTIDFIYILAHVFKINVDRDGII